MSGKKIAIIGKGTAGCLSYLKALQIKNTQKHLGVEIDWYYDSATTPLSVGEGTTPHFARHLESFGVFSTTNDLDKVDGRPKIGIEYQNWGKKDFVHPFGFGMHGVHFNANKFQDLVFNEHTAKENVTLHDKNVSHGDIDSDVIIDCTGKPKSLDNYDIPKYIPVNAVHVQQCKWLNEPKYLHTKTIARPWGWVFVIPLTSRCSVGYLYNKDITPLNAIKTDIEEVIASLDVEKTTVTNSFQFDNYVRKELFDGRVAYAGNSGFFLEPMEATTLDSVFRVIHCIDHKIDNDGFNDTYNWHMKRFFQEVEYFITMHYAAGSKWNNEFWDFAQERGIRAVEEAKKDKFFGPVIRGHAAPNTSKYVPYYCQYSWKSNVEGLGLDL
jgi:tryptophan 7-halogenase